MSFNLTAIHSAIIAALVAGDAFEAELTKLQVLFKGANRAAVKAVVCPIVAAHYGETFADGEWADSFCAAKRKANRVIKAIVDTEATPKESAHTAVNEKVLAALVGTVVDAGLSKKEFAAMLTALRAAISFE
jgi:uncharacterized protein with ATP-grasp and redox domains